MENGLPFWRMGFLSGKRACSMENRLALWRRVQVEDNRETS